MTPERWLPIQPILDEFNSALAAHIPRFELVGLNEKGNIPLYEQRRTDRLFKQWGVYLIFDSVSQLKYVGLAMNCFDNRVWSHDRWIPDRKWTDGILFLAGTVAFAPALEFYLITRLRPPGNTMYKNYEALPMMRAPKV